MAEERSTVAEDYACAYVRWGQLLDDYRALVKVYEKLSKETWPRTVDEVTHGLREEGPQDPVDAVLLDAQVALERHLGNEEGTGRPRLVRHIANYRVYDPRRSSPILEKVKKRARKAAKVTEK